MGNLNNNSKPGTGEKKKEDRPKGKSDFWLSVAVITSMLALALRYKCDPNLRNALKGNPKVTQTVTPDSTIKGNILGDTIPSDSIPYTSKDSLPRHMLVLNGYWGYQILDEYKKELLDVFSDECKVIENLKLSDYFEFIETPDENWNYRVNIKDSVPIDEEWNIMIDNTKFNKYNKNDRIDGYGYYFTENGVVLWYYKKAPVALKYIEKENDETIRTTYVNELSNNGYCNISKPDTVYTQSIED